MWLFFVAWRARWQGGAVENVVGKGHDDGFAFRIGEEFYPSFDGELVLAKRHRAFVDVDVEILEPDFIRSDEASYLMRATDHSAGKNEDS